MKVIMSAMTIVYDYFDQSPLYVNVTNRCTNRCTFCIRNTATGVAGFDLWLEHEPSAQEMIDALEAHGVKNREEVVFCGYGEPLLRYQVVFEVCRYLRANTSVKIRVNTNGHANRAAGKDITPEMEGLFDQVSISLNAKNREEYEKVCLCQYGEEGFDIMLDFAARAKNHVPQVILSVVDVLPKEDIDACRMLAEKIGVAFRVREYAE